MPATVIAGVQWGDEGKGRMVDLLARDSDIVVRCQGGPNAGHTVINDFGKYILHSIPSGIFQSQALNIIGPGTVINPSGLAAEIKMLKREGIDVSRLLISERAHLILPYHIAFEQLDESHRAEHDKIEPTGQGIAPAYADKAARCGLRVEDLLDISLLRQRIEEELAWKNKLLTLYGQPILSLDAILAEIEPAAEFLAPYIGDTVVPITDALRNGKRVLLEGQLGVMRDIDWGAYPYVTSSSPTPTGIAAGAGVPPQYVDRVIGVLKAYTTSVGTSPFPTELFGDECTRLRETGGEYGATTGRPRRCGWFDAVAAAWAARVAGFTEIALTKIDVLDQLSEVPLCVDYRYGDNAVSKFPTTRLMAEVKPQYQRMPGWLKSTRDARTIDQLPTKAQKYVDEIERRIGLPIKLISVGPERDFIIVRA